MENEEILEIVKCLFNLASTWDEQTAILYDKRDEKRDGPKYRDKKTIEQMVENGLLIEIKNHGLEPRYDLSGEVSLSDLLPTIIVRYQKIDLAKFLVRKKILKWGKLKIYPNSVFEFDGVKSKELFTIDSDQRKFIAYLILLKDIPNQIADKLLEKKIIEGIDQPIEQRMKTIKSQAITQLIDKYKMPEEYAKNMIQNIKKYGHILVDFDVAESKISVTKM